MCSGPQPPHLLPEQLFTLEFFSNFLINGESLHGTGLCLIWFGVTIFSFSLLLPCPVTSVSLISWWLPFIIPLFRRGWMSDLLREHLNHLLVVLVSILVYLWFLSIQVASSPSLTWGILIVICIYLLLRCQLSDMYGSLFSMVIMLSPFIYRMHIYIFLLLSIIIIYYVLFGKMCLINGGFYLLGRPQTLCFHPLTKPILLLCHHKGFCIAIYLDDFLVLVPSRQAGKRAHSFLWSLLVRFGLHINFSKSYLCLTQTFCFLGLCWDTVCMSVSLPLDN